MAKKKVEDNETIEPVMNDPFIGGEDDDLSDMEYIQDETTTTLVDTHPPETEEEAKLLEEQETAEAAKAEEELTDEEKAAAEAAAKEKEELTDEEKAAAKAEEEEELTDEEKAAAEEAAKAAEEDGIKVPKDRFDEVNDRMKTAEKKVESLEKQLEGVIEEQNAEEPLPPYDYAAKEKEAMDALLEGDQEAYAALRTEIREAERAETLAEARKVAESGDVRTREDVDFEEAGSVIETNFPEFSTQSETYNAEAREEMIDLYIGYAQSGKYSRVESLQRAADKAARMYSLEGANAEPPPDNVVELKPVDVKKKAEIAENQPPELKGKAAGEDDEPKLNLQTMSDEQFDGLPESTKRRLRGDVV